MNNKQSILATIETAAAGIAVLGVLLFAHAQLILSYMH